MGEDESQTQLDAAQNVEQPSNVETISMQNSPSCAESILAFDTKIEKFWMMTYPAAGPGAGECIQDCKH